MRTGRINKDLIKDEEGKVIGINLGADFCAEHEWGISHLKETLGHVDKIGIKGRTNTVLPGNLIVFFEDEKFVVFLLATYDFKAKKLRESFQENSLTKLINGCKSPFDFDGIYPEYDCSGKRRKIKEAWQFTGAWSDRDFGILAKKNSEAGKYVKKLYEAIQNKDLLTMIGGSKLPIFDNGGLILAVASDVPEEAKKAIKDADKDRIALKKAAEKTKIEKYLTKNMKVHGGPPFFALSPHWADSIKNVDTTKYDVVFWLNPRDQKNNNFGYFTVEDLKAWIKGEGPIPKKNQT